MKTRTVRTCGHCGTKFERVPSQRGQYCSKECAYDARRKEETAARRMIHAPGHPLALNGPLVPEYRVILYSAIGGGSHPCHHCGISVQWNPGGGCSEGVLVVDHLDRNPLNNSLDNIVPSCQRCNILNSERTIRDDEVFVVRKDGTRVRGERRNCGHCGTKFVTYVRKARPNSGRFCSRSCARSKPKN
ncbi:HNH endonuclease signature motif containing protein [Streptomyces sp. NPDC056982]|uniref:HNH endonuclease signature motif containing protein n=1 Tax=Streptomyces sp. NPDC056982 TaxID=3345986 RepID=UPI003631CF52